MQPWRAKIVHYYSEGNVDAEDQLKIIDRSQFFIPNFFAARILKVILWKKNCKFFQARKTSVR